jgi:uncharacterized protein YdhG (YjbR/CyaY superfamily)
MTKPENFDEYLNTFPDDTKKYLLQIREAVRKSVPGAEEVISYGMPAFKFRGPLLYYAAYKHHIGLYPMSTAIEAFRPFLKEYKCSKGTIQFPLDKPLPLDLIDKIVKFRVNENLAKSIKRK